MPRGSNCTGKNPSARLESVNSCWYRTLASSATASTPRMLFLLRVKKFESCLFFTNNIFPKRRTRDSELSLNFNGWGATTCARSSFRWWCWWSSLGSRSSSSSVHTTHASPSCHSRCSRWSFCATSSKPPKLPTLKRSIFTREFPWLLLSLPSTVSSVNKSIRNWFKDLPFQYFCTSTTTRVKTTKTQLPKLTNFVNWRILPCLLSSTAFIGQFIKLNRCQLALHRNLPVMWAYCGEISSATKLQCCGFKFQLKLSSSV